MSTPKWPADHKEKHAAAARLGWERRRGHLHRPTKRNETRTPGERSLRNQRAKIAVMERELDAIQTEAKHYAVTSRGNQPRQEHLARLIHQAAVLQGQIDRRKQKLARDERR